MFLNLLDPDPDSEPDLDPLVRGTDPRIRIRNKMSLIRYTVFSALSCHFLNCLSCTVENNSV
jgi:hypothetical protein